MTTAKHASDMRRFWYRLLKLACICIPAAYLFGLLLGKMLH